MKRPLCFDLCCGLGGWAEGLIAAGLDVWGFDTNPAFVARYPGRFSLIDVRDVNGNDLRLAATGRAVLVVASPPCQEFTRHDLPWLAKKNPPDPDKSIWQACFRIASQAQLPIILENVRGAQRFMGPAAGRYGSQFLWGEVPALMPKVRVRGTRPAKDPATARRLHRRYTSSDLRPGEVRGKETLPHNPAERAKIPFELAYYIGTVFNPQQHIARVYKPLEAR